MSVVSIRDWTDFSASQSAQSRLAQVAAAWVALGILGAVVGVVGGWRRKRQGHRRVARMAVGVLAIAFVAGCGAVRVPGQAVAWVAGHRVGWVDASANPVQRVDADGVRAAQWIRDHSDVDDVVVTNVLCSNGSTREVDVCDNQTFWVTAYAERRTVVSGWGYTATSNGLASEAGLANSWQLPFWDQPRLDAVRDFLSRPTTSGARQLAERGACWVLAVPGHDEVSPFLPEVAAPAFRAGDVVVYRLPSPDRSSSAAQLPSS